MTLSPKEYAKLAPVIKISEGEKEILYFGPNEMADWRCKTLYSKEPSTIAWLKRIGEDDILLDVGANVGMYSIYAAGMQGCNQVISIEPESQNFSILCKNIILNKLQDKILPFCCSLSEKQEIGKLFLSKFLWDGGGSCHSFNEEVGFNLEYREAPFKQGSIGITLDQAVDSGSIPVPDYIKIDVDGFEHKVISGSLNTLKTKKVRSISIELNLNLQEHLKTIETLRDLGFDYNEDQASNSLRKEGPFKNCGEFIFDRIDPSSILPLLQASSPVKSDNTNDDYNPINKPNSSSQRANIQSGIFSAALRIKNSPMTSENPFPYLKVDDIFDLNFYKTICEMFPSKSHMTPLSETGRSTGGHYKERYILLLNKDSDLNKLPTKERVFWDNFRKSLHSEAVITPLIDKFWPWCKNRIAAAIDYAKYDLRRIEMDTLLVNDQTNYSIGPHTDSPHRLFSLLFYLPDNKDYAQYGTRFYRPKDRLFTCPGGPHYKFEQFEEIAAADYIPNSLVAFVRTDKSFHGVPKINSSNINRKLIIANLRLTR